MGDIENYLRQKFRQESSKGTFLLRDPKLSDEENSLLLRPYSGNPFIAPGTIGCKSKHKTIQGQLVDESYVFDDDTVMPRSANVDSFSNHSSTQESAKSQSSILQIAIEQPVS